MLVARIGRANFNTLVDNPHRVVLLMAANTKTLTTGERKVASIAGLLIMGASNIAFAVMTVILKITYLRSDISVFEVTYFRGVALFLLNLAYAKSTGVKVMEIPPLVASQLLARVGFGLFAMTTFYLSNKLLPVSLAAVLSATDPIFTAIIGWLLFSEKLTKFDITALVLAFCGVVCILLNPMRHSSGGKSINVLYMLVPLMSAVACGFVYNFTRQLAQAVHWIIAPTYFGLGIACIIPVLLLTGSSLTGHLTMYSASVVALMVAMYFAGWLGQLFMSKALQVEVAGRVTVINYSQIVILFVCDVAFFHEQINIVDVLGTALIIGCNFTIGLLKFLGRI